MAATEEVLGKSLVEPGSDPSPFSPEPESLKVSLRAPLCVQQAWGKATKKEAKRLSCNMKVFDAEPVWRVPLEPPSHGHDSPQVGGHAVIAISLSA